MSAQFKPVAKLPSAKQKKLKMPRPDAYGRRLLATFADADKGRWYEVFSTKFTAVEEAKRAKDRLRWYYREGSPLGYRYWEKRKFTSDGRAFIRWLARKEDR